MSNAAHWLQQFQSLRLKNDDYLWLSELRNQAFLRWQETGFPTPSHPRWKYTELMGLAQTDFQLLPTASLMAESDLPTILDNAISLVFIDGQFNVALSSVQNNKAIYCGSLKEALQLCPEKIAPYFESTAVIADGFEDLNTAFAQDGAVVFISPNEKITSTIHLLYLHTDTPSHMSHTKNILMLAENAQATILEQHIGQDNCTYFTTNISSLYLAEHALLNYYRCQESGDKAYQINHIYLNQEKASQMHFFGLDLKGHLLRNEIQQVFAGPEAICQLTGFYLGKNKQHIDNYLNIHHQVAHCQSNQRFKGVLDDRARAVFHGKIYVAPDAQKTDAKQHNANLLLSNQAQIESEPQLEIFADDVKCAHGSAIGQLDEDALFYLQSRGLDAKTARQMLIYSFAAEILQQIEEPALQIFCQARMNHYFPDMPLPEAWL